MIELKLQIASLLFSYIFGVFLAFSSALNYLFIKNKLVKIIFTFLITVVYVLLYFIGLTYINDGYLHLYFILMVTLGYLSEIFFIKKIFVKVKRKWYNYLKIGD